MHINIKRVPSFTALSRDDKKHCDETSVIIKECVITTSSYGDKITAACVCVCVCSLECSGKGQLMLMEGDISFSALIRRTERGEKMSYSSTRVTLSALRCHYSQTHTQSHTPDVLLLPNPTKHDLINLIG